MFLWALFQAVISPLDTSWSFLPLPLCNPLWVLFKDSLSLMPHMPLLASYDLHSLVSPVRALAPSHCKQMKANRCGLVLRATGVSRMVLGTSDMQHNRQQLARPSPCQSKGLEREVPIHVAVVTSRWQPLAFPTLGLLLVLSFGMFPLYRSNLHSCTHFFKFMVKFSFLFRKPTLTNLGPHSSLFTLDFVPTVLFSYVLGCEVPQSWTLV